MRAPFPSRFGQAMFRDAAVTLGKGSSEHEGMEVMKMTLEELWREFQDYKDVEIRVNTYTEPMESEQAQNAYYVAEMKTGEVYIAITS